MTSSTLTDNQKAGYRAELIARLKRATARSDYARCWELAAKLAEMDARETREASDARCR